MTDFDWLAVGGRLCLDCDFLMQIRPGDKAEETCYSCRTEKAAAEVALKRSTFPSAWSSSGMVPNFRGLGTVDGPRSGAGSSND